MGEHGGMPGDYRGWPAPALVAVLFVGGVTVLSVLATTLVILSGRSAPDGLLAVSSAGVGSLSTFLARTKE